MTRAANDVMQSILFSAVLDAIAALKAGSGGLPNNLLRDVQAIHPNVTFADDPHPPCPRFEECVGGAVVGARASIGANATILPGVRIGSDALVGAGSVVVDDVPDGTVVAGNPAKVLGRVQELTCRAGHYGRPYEWREGAER
jgi:UDP-3-O-[3-hydroxymyristoyl] glucosamine N-acyltransferase